MGEIAPACPGCGDGYRFRSSRTCGSGEGNLERLYRIGRAFEPAAHGDTERVGVRNVRFDVEHGCALEHVDAAHVQREPLHGCELEHAETDRVRPVRRARREDTAPMGAPLRQHLGSPALVEVKPEQHPHERPAVEVGERMLEVASAEQFDAATHVARCRGLARSLDTLAKRRVNDPDGTTFEDFLHVGRCDCIGRCREPPAPSPRRLPRRRLTRSRTHLGRPCRCARGPTDAPSTKTSPDARSFPKATRRPAPPRASRCSTQSPEPLRR